MDEVLLKDIVPRLGRLIKLYREKTGQNQSDIAVKAGISISMLSQIERGVVSPSIDTLVMVCEALGMNPSELFTRLSLKSPVRIHHPDERLKMRSGGIRYEQLITTSDSAYPAELCLIEVKPGNKTVLSKHGHEGVEMGFVLSGTGVLIIDGSEYVVKGGDSISFNSNHPHQLRNTGNTVLKAVWSIAPPHVDYLNVNDNDTNEEA